MITSGKGRSGGLDTFLRNLLIWFVLSLMLVGLGYRLYLSFAIERFHEQSHLQGQLLANQTAARIRLIVSALEMFSEDPHLATYLAAGGTLPPYARNRIEPAIALLGQNLPVTDWAVARFTEGPHMLVKPEDPHNGPPLAKLLAEWSASRDPAYQVRLAKEGSTLLYSAPVVYQGEVHGFFAISFAKQVLQVPPGEFQLGLREARSGAVLSPFPEPQSPLYRETFAVGTSPDQGEWLLDLHRPDGQFWDSQGVFQARLTSALSLLLSLLAGVSVLSSLDRRAALIASRAKSDMLSHVSHEIRNPLTGILGLTQRTLETPLAPGQRDHLRSIAYSAQSLMGLLDDLLDHAKVEAGVLDFHPVPMSLRAVIAQALDGFKAVPGRDNVSLLQSLPEGLPDAYVGDPQRLRQLLINLLSNALKFTEQGHVQVAVESEGSDERGRAILHFVVSDTGTGIAPDQLRRIFEAFRQADPSIPGKYGGTGLGLSICREFVSRMDGRIWAESELGKGSQFHFLVHLPKAAKVPEEAPAPPCSRGLKILLAEDGTINLKLGRSLLEEMGHQVKSAKDGLQVLRLVEEEPFDLVLMDLAMPTLDGLETTRKLRANGFSELVIVALTGSADSDDRQRSMSAGMNGHLVKPLTERSFLRMTTDLLKER